MLRKIFGPKRYKVTEERRKIHNEELNHLYSSPNIIQAIKSKRIVWGACSKYREEERCMRGVPKITGLIFLKWVIIFYTITTLVSFKVLSF